MKECTVKLIWEDGVWICETDEDLGIVFESGSFDALIERVKIAVPEMLELNCGYKGDIQLTFIVERVDNLKTKAVAV